MLKQILSDYKELLEKSNMVFGPHIRVDDDCDNEFEELAPTRQLLECYAKYVSFMTDDLNDEMELRPKTDIHKRLIANLRNHPAYGNSFELEGNTLKPKNISVYLLFFLDRLPRDIAIDIVLESCPFSFLPVAKDLRTASHCLIIRDHGLVKKSKNLEIARRHCIVHSQVIVELR